jgi:hypothetical protein
VKNHSSERFFTAADGEEIAVETKRKRKNIERKRKKNKTKRLKIPILQCPMKLSKLTATQHQFELLAPFAVSASTSIFLFNKFHMIRLFLLIEEKVLMELTCHQLE